MIAVVLLLLLVHHVLAAILIRLAASATDCAALLAALPPVCRVPCCRLCPRLRAVRLAAAGPGCRRPQPHPLAAGGDACRHSGTCSVGLEVVAILCNCLLKAACSDFHSD